MRPKLSLIYLNTKNFKTASRIICDDFPSPNGLCADIFRKHFILQKTETSATISSLFVPINLAVPALTALAPVVRLIQIQAFQGGASLATTESLRTRYSFSWKLPIGRNQEVQLRKLEDEPSKALSGSRTVGLR